MMSTSILLAFLVGISEYCSTNAPKVGATYVTAVEKAGGTPLIIPRQRDAKAYDELLAKFDLLILPGGEDVSPARYGEEAEPALGTVSLARDQFEFDLLSAAVRRELPILGVCRGHQMINVFFGGTLHQDLPSNYGENYTIEHRTGLNKGEAFRGPRHDISIATSSRLADATGAKSRRVNSLHHQAVKGLAPNFTVSATTGDGSVEAIECQWYPVAGVQFHPEALSTYLDDPFAERLFANVFKFVGRPSAVPLAERPIGVFDSGIGGLSVLEHLLARDDLASENFVFFGDQANMPYGRYNAEGRADFLRELAVRDAQFVLGGQGHVPAKIVVVACNTATAFGLSAIEAMPRPHDARVIGVVNAGVEGALDCLRAETKPYAIGVLATPGTIETGVYEKTIRAELHAHGVSVPVEVESRGGVGLAEAVENHAPDRDLCAETNLVALVESYRARGGHAPLKAIILGCTHYPYVRTVFEATIQKLKADPRYTALIADDLKFIDPAEYTAAQCAAALKKLNLLRPSTAAASAEPRVKAFISVGENGPLPDAVKYGRAPLARSIGTKIVPLTKDSLSREVVSSIRATCPRSAKVLEF